MTAQTMTVGMQATPKSPSTVWFQILIDPDDVHTFEDAVAIPMVVSVDRAAGERMMESYEARLGKAGDLPEVLVAGASDGLLRMVDPSTAELGRITLEVDDVPDLPKEDEVFEEEQPAEEPEPAKAAGA